MGTKSTLKATLAVISADVSSVLLNLSDGSADVVELKPDENGTKWGYLHNVGNVLVDNGTVKVVPYGSIESYVVPPSPKGRLIEFTFNGVEVKYDFVLDGGSDYWHSFCFNGFNFDIHVEDNDIVVYEHAIADELSHRYNEVYKDLLFAVGDEVKVLDLQFTGLGIEYNTEYIGKEGVVEAISDADLLFVDVTIEYGFNLSFNPSNLALIKRASYDLKFDRYSDIGIPMYSVTDVDGIDPIGELVLIDDYFLKDRRYNIVHPAPHDYVSLTLPLLTTPRVDNACRVMEEVFTNNDADDLLDEEFYKECASLVIGELELGNVNKCATYDFGMSGVGTKAEIMKALSSCLELIKMTDDDDFEDSHDFQLHFFKANMEKHE